VAEKLCDGTTELERGHSTAVTKATAMTEEHFKEEGGGLIDRNDPNKQQVSINFFCVEVQCLLNADMSKYM